MATVTVPSNTAKMQSRVMCPPRAGPSAIAMPRANAARFADLPVQLIDQPIDRSITRSHRACAGLARRAHAVLEREQHGELGADVGCRVDRDEAAVELDQAARHVQA